MLYIKALDRDQVQYIYKKKSCHSLFLWQREHGDCKFEVKKRKAWRLVYNTHLFFATFVISTFSVWLLRKVLRHYKKYT